MRRFLAWLVLAAMSVHGLAAATTVLCPGHAPAHPRATVHAQPDQQHASPSPRQRAHASDGRAAAAAAAQPCGLCGTCCDAASLMASHWPAEVAVLPRGTIADPDSPRLTRFVPVPRKPPRG